MILFTVNGLDLRVLDAGRELTRKSLSPIEAATLASDLLDGLRNHIAQRATDSPVEADLQHSHLPQQKTADAPHRGLISTTGGNA
jgi:hypothetical protein